MTTPTTFHLFPLLPVELRLRIYTLSSSHSRIIHLRTPDRPSKISYRPSPHPFLSSSLKLSYSDIPWTTRTPPPPLLSVSRETRAFALSNYTLKFAHLPVGREIIYINPKLDIVLVHLEKWPKMLKVLLGDLRAFDVVNKGRGVRRLAISTGVWATWFNEDVNVVKGKRVEMIGGLEELIVLHDEGWEEEDMYDEEGGGVLVEPEGWRDVVCWEEDVLHDWQTAKDAGLGDEVKLSMLTWRPRE